MINYFTGRPGVDAPGSEVCTVELHLTGAAVQERVRLTRACWILGSGSCFPGLFPQSVLSFAQITLSSCLKDRECKGTLSISGHKENIDSGKGSSASCKPVRVGAGVEFKVELFIGVILLFCLCQFWGRQLRNLYNIVGLHFKCL